MNWVVFTASLPSKGSSSPRVMLWRRLRRLGAIVPAGSTYILPARDACVEAFQWLAQEIRQSQGEAMVMHVTHFDGLTDPQLVALFQAARSAEYTELDREVAVLEQTLHAGADGEQREQLQETLDKLRRRHAEIARVDYFNCPQGGQGAARLARVARLLAPVRAVPVVVAPAVLAAYREARWLTRPRPHVDRLACAWLIRRYINPTAPIRYGTQLEPDEVPFDMADAQFGHQGNLCSFETMVHAFDLDEPALRAMGEIVHAIDLRDGLYARSETAGIEAVLDGWQMADLRDGQREAQGIALFDGLYTALAQATASHRDADVPVGDAPDATVRARTTLA